MSAHSSLTPAAPFAAGGASIVNLSEVRARALHEKAQRRLRAGDPESALQLYLQALKNDPQRASTLYNVGLIYKSRRAWREALDYTLRAAALCPEDPASNWNAGLAATALGEWQAARAAWRRAGIELEDQHGPVRMRLGSTPLRLNAHAKGEIVWAQRIDPVRAYVRNVPLPASGFGYSDLVLHDGAPVGTRPDAHGTARPVFNVLQLLAASPLSTYTATVRAGSSAAVQALQILCEARRMPFEDWTRSVRTLCRACSEGRAHAAHDEPAGAAAAGALRHLGFACDSERAVHEVLERWCREGYGTLISAPCCVLDAGARQSTYG